LPGFPGEQEYINNFFKIWTKKEAYIKYTGKGLAEGLSTFSVNQLDGVYFKRIAGLPGAYIYICCGEDNQEDLCVEYM
jgi:phosphopantetheinyl transferase